MRALRTAQAGAAAALGLLSGAAECIAAYEAERDRECARYLAERARYYDIERRWDVAPFWRRRATAHGACDA